VSLTERNQKKFVYFFFDILLTVKELTNLKSEMIKIYLIGKMFKKYKLSFRVDPFFLITFYTFHFNKEVFDWILNKSAIILNTVTKLKNTDVFTN